VVGAEAGGIQSEAVSGKDLVESPFDVSVGLLIEQPSSDARLVGDHDQKKPGIPEKPEALHDTGE
jgi:hypothetical protein